ncbi:helix-turn-helix transcriptional regulator [Archangium sp.]|uniref:helix-turn-helix domain-containing protein n=1 Tax=Archangium sp. TaxID=1872627 RepID=UPI002D2A42EF|nr:helix-turn-helix transcriptional regulator [Archangium sp.]HYO58021.1 helix-turn-helix transcriptional regulator [Archangium sp.]
MEEKLQPRLGTELRKARMRLDLTQEQVAHAVGFVPTVYGRIERGDMMPSTPKLRALCILLGISAEALLPPPLPEEMPPADLPPPVHEDPPEFRRLAMLVRELPPERLRLFRIALQTLLEPKERKEPQEPQEPDDSDESDESDEPDEE